MERRKELWKLMIRAIFLMSLLSLNVRAQDVPPPPKPDATPALAPILGSLKQTLLASGRVNYTVGTSQFHQRITSVTEEPSDCKIRVGFESSNDYEAPSTSYFFESIDTVESMTLAEADARQTARIGKKDDDLRTAGGYVVVINGSVSRLKIADGSVAAQAAGLMRRAAEVCRAMPVKLNATAGTPTLDETLVFVAQKLNAETGIVYRATSSAGDPSIISDRVLNARGDPASCQVRFKYVGEFDNKPFLNYDFVFSFRRVEKLEVLTEQELWDRTSEHNGSRNETRLSPTTYKVLLYSSGSEQLGAVNFRDEEMANRVAKAMLHAVELCRSATKEPF